MSDMPCGDRRRELLPAARLSFYFNTAPRSNGRGIGVTNHLCEAPGGPVPGKWSLTLFSRAPLIDCRGRSAKDELGLGGAICCDDVFAFGELNAAGATGTFSAFMMGGPVV
jgi:hypothetical protein